MGGRRRRDAPRDSGERKAPREPLLETRLSPRALFEVAQQHGAEKKDQLERLKKAEKKILDIYSSFSPEERVEFLSILYDRFAENYDHHMGVETDHYKAIRRVLQFATPYIRPPILDLTAGTGEPLLYALEMMDFLAGLQKGPLRAYFPQIPVPETGLLYLAQANEISPKMLEIAKEKLAKKTVAFSSYDAYSMPRNLRGKFNTVLCSQTFHVISDEDKPRMAKAIMDALAPGGVAIVIEEDPFTISQTESIGAVGMFLRAIVRPIDAVVLAGRIQAVGLTQLDESATAPIDEHHIMRLHLFANISEPAPSRALPSEDYTRGAAGSNLL